MQLPRPGLGTVNGLMTGASMYADPHGTGAAAPGGRTAVLRHLACAWLLVSLPGPAQADATEPAFEDFVGAEACAACHPKQYQAWQGSTHGRAGAPPGPGAAISKFDGTVLRFADAVVTLEETDDHRYLFHVQRPGQPRFTFTVDAFVGGGHMIGGGTQTTFTRAPDGSLRLLPFDYIRGEDLWFCHVDNTRGWVPITQSLSLEECKYWPPQSNFGNNCGECHSSQMQSRYHPELRREEVRYKSLAINCESCHGPGRRHVELVSAADAGDLVDIGMEPLALTDKDGSLEICFRCHAIKQRLTGGFLPGRRFEDYYAINFFQRVMQHPDGRVRGFGYQEGHRYSDCYLNGSMTCVDCHDPHSQDYRDVDGFPLIGKFDDGQCTACHAAKAVEPGRHTRHAPDSPGSRCTACHMPFYQHADFGQELRFARSDHTIAIPRPALDSSLGLDNACNQCHEDRGVAWQQARVDEWHGEPKPHDPIIDALMQVQADFTPATVRRVFLQDYDSHPAAEFELLRVLSAWFNGAPNQVDPAVVEKVKGLAGADDPDLRALALVYLHEARDSDAEIPPLLVQALSSPDADAAFRRRLGLLLQIWGGGHMSRGQTERALSAYRKAVEVDPERAGAYFALGAAYQHLKRPMDALEQFRRVMRIGSPTDHQHVTLMQRVCGLYGGLLQTGADRDPELEKVCRP